MITIPFPLFTAISVVLIIGFVWDLKKYIRISSAILYIGFWLSFNASGTPPLFESLFNGSSSVFDSVIDSSIVMVLKPMLYLFGSVLCISILYACIRAYQYRSHE